MGGCNSIMHRQVSACSSTMLVDEEANVFQPEQVDVLILVGYKTAKVRTYSQVAG